MLRADSGVTLEMLKKMEPFGGRQVNEQMNLNSDTSKEHLTYK